MTIDRIVAERNNPPQRSARESLLPPVLGIVDASVIIGYVVGIDPILWHLCTLTLKIAIALISRRNLELPRAGALFISSVILLLAVSVIQFPNMGGSVQALGFACHLLLTLVLLRFSEMRRYCAAAATEIAVVGLLHLSLCVTGRMPNQYGRYLYFGENQPNLGGEINAIGAFVAICGLKRKNAAFALAILSADNFMLQARSAILVCLFAWAIVIVFDDSKRISVRRFFALLWSILAGIALLLSLNKADSITDALTSSMMLNDQYRGLGSDYSGRGELWSIALQLFEDSPLLGHGIGFFNSIDYVGPHNILLFALAQNGVIGLIPIGLLIGFSAKWWLKSPFFMAAFFCIIPLLLFNDRFFNVNPYPFLLYVVILGSDDVSLRGIPQTRSMRVSPVEQRYYANMAPPPTPVHNRAI